MSLLLPDSGLLFWMFVAFGVVFVILAKYGFPIIIKMVEGRKTYIDQSLEVAREANAQLAHLKEEGEALVAAANKEQGRILKEAMEERDKIVHEARKEEVEHAEEEGIVFKTLTNPTEVLGDENGWVKGMTCVEMELGEPDASGRRR